MTFDKILEWKAECEKHVEIEQRHVAFEEEELRHWQRKLADAIRLVEDFRRDAAKGGKPC